MTPALLYKHVIIRITKCLRKGEEINDITVHERGDNQGQYSTIYLRSIINCLTNGSKLLIFLSTW